MSKQGSVATFLKCGADVNNQIKKCLLLSLTVKKITSVYIWQIYKQGEVHEKFHSDFFQFLHTKELLWALGPKCVYGLRI